MPHASLIRLIMLCCLAVGFCLTPLWAKKNITFDTLVIKGKTFTQVEVLSSNPQTITFKHSKGITQVKLTDLDPKTQAIFNYSPAEAIRHKRLLEEKRQAGIAQLEAWQSSRNEEIKKKKAKLAHIETKAQALFNQFKSAPILQSNVDLRPKLQELDLFTSKSQGLRPSCSVFAILTAVEFENATQTKKAQRFSEEYLLWATLKNRSLGKTLDSWSIKESPRFAYADAGFTLFEVFEALKEYGILLKDELPYSWGNDYTNLQEPTSDQIVTAQNRLTLKPYRIPGTSRKHLVQNIIHVLNAGLPVVIGAKFPQGKDLVRTHILRNQAPLSGHAVTLVGYKNPEDNNGEFLFIFKNSWGPRWGLGGYGFIDYNYLVENVSEAYFLQIEIN